MTNVLITGIDGFVGSHLVESLLSQSDVRLLGIVRSRSSLQFINHLDSKIALEEADITDFIKLRDTISRFKPEKIFHLAGQAYVPKSIEDPLSTFNTNVNGTLNVLESVRLHANENRAHCSVLFVSTGEVYGNVAVGQLPIDEHALINPTNPYAASKAAAEILALQYRSAFGLNVVIGRSFNHIGPRQSEQFVGSAFAKQVAEIKLKLREPKIMVGNLDPERNFTDVRDVVQAYITLLSAQRKHAIYNICSEQSISIRELLAMLCDISGIKVEIVPDTTRQRKDEIPKILGNAHRLRSETGWKPMIPLKTTLQDLLSYWEKFLTNQR